MYVWAKEVFQCVVPWGRTVDPAQDQTEALFKHPNTPGALKLLQSSAQTSSPQACSPTDGLVLPLLSSSALSCCFLSCQKCCPRHWKEQETGAAEPGCRQELSVGAEHSAPEPWVSAPATALLLLLKQPKKHLIFLGVKGNVNTRHIHENSTELSIYTVKRSPNKFCFDKFKIPFETSRLYIMRPPAAI